MRVLERLPAAAAEAQMPSASAPRLRCQRTRAEPAPAARGQQPEAGEQAELVRHPAAPGKGEHRSAPGCHHAWITACWGGRRGVAGHAIRSIAPLGQAVCPGSCTQILG